MPGFRKSGQSSKGGGEGRRGGGRSYKQAAGKGCPPSPSWAQLSLLPEPREKPGNRGPGSGWKGSLSGSCSLSDLNRGGAPGGGFVSHAMLINSIVIFCFRRQSPSSIGALSPARILYLAPVYQSLCQYLGQRGLEAEPVDFSGPGFRWRETGFSYGRS